MKYFFVAGETSGDLHASFLAKSIAMNEGSEAIMTGWGSEHMEKAGVKLQKDIGGKAVMGFSDVVKNISKVFNDFKLIKSQIEEFNPDRIILVDFGGFNLRLAKWAFNKKYKVVYFIPPKVWAWNTRRVFKIKKYTNLVLCIFPFELDFYSKYDLKAYYIGNPTYLEVKSFKASKDFLKDNKLENEKIIALLPGSRPSEIKNMAEVMTKLSEKFKGYTFVVAGLSNLDQKLYDPLKEIKNIRIILDSSYDILENAEAAVVTSGTATLETALFNVPQVVVYRTQELTYQLAKAVVKIEKISLVNIIAQKDVVTELVQANYTVENVTKELNLLLDDNKIKEKMLSDYKNVSNLLSKPMFPGQAYNEIKKI